MKTEELKTLLERYYRGETTLPEEQLLKSYFLQNDVPDGLKADRETFLFLSGLSQQDADLPTGLEERLSACIAGWEANEAPRPSAKTYRLSSVALRWCMGVAAALLITVGAGMYLLKASSHPQDTFDNPQLAYAEAQRALQLFAMTLNKGQTQVTKAESQTRLVREKLEKCYNNLTDTPEKQ